MPPERPLVSAPPAAASAGSWWALLALAVVLVGAVYGGSLRHPFTRDDTAHFADRARWERPPAEWGVHFREEFWGRQSQSGLYRPLTALTLQLQLWAGGGLPPTGVVPAPPAPLALRLGNLALLAAVAASAGWLALRLGATRSLAFAATALLAVHPLLSEDALELVSRSETQAALGVLLAAGLLARDATASWSRSALAGLCFLFALGSKEGAFAALPFLLWIARGALRPAMALVAAALVALAGRVEVFGDLVGFDPAETAFVDNPLIAAPFATRLLTGIAVLGRHLFQLAWPAQLSIDWSYAAIRPLDSPADRWFLLGAAGLVVGLVALGVAWRRGARGVVAGLLLAGATWFLVSSIARPVGTVMGERLFTLPAVGLIVAFAAAASRCRAAVRALALLAIVPALVALGVRTHARAADWRDGLALYQSAATVAPDSARVQATLAHLEFVRQQPVAAADHARRALAVLPEYGKPHETLANCFAAQGLLGRSLVHLWLAAHAIGADGAALRQVESARGAVLRDERHRLDFLRYGREVVAGAPTLPLHAALAAELDRVERGGR